jgi:hypothetical protein
MSGARYCLFLLNKMFKRLSDFLRVHTLNGCYNGVVDGFHLMVPLLIEMSICLTLRELTANDLNLFF